MLRIELRPAIWLSMNSSRLPSRSKSSSAFSSTRPCSRRSRRPPWRTNGRGCAAARRGGPRLRSRSSHSRRRAARRRVEDPLDREDRPLGTGRASRSCYRPRAGGIRVVVVDECAVLEIGEDVLPVLPGEQDVLAGSGIDRGRTISSPKSWTLPVRTFMTASTPGAWAAVRRRDRDGREVVLRGDPVVGLRLLPQLVDRTAEGLHDARGERRDERHEGEARSSARRRWSRCAAGCAALSRASTPAPPNRAARPAEGLGKRAHEP